jgi:hypothetical protein
MTQPPSLVWGQRVQTTAATIVIPLDSNTQQDQAMFQSDGNGVMSPTPYSQVQSNLCITRNDPCVPATPSFTGSTLGAGLGLAGVIVTPPTGPTPPPTGYWLYDAATPTCYFSSTIIGGSTFWTSENACRDANGLPPITPPPPVDYWAFDLATQTCQLNPTIIGGTTTYTTEAACQAAHPEVYP